MNDYYIYFDSGVKDYFPYYDYIGHFLYFPDDDYIGYFPHVSKTPALLRRSPSFRRRIRRSLLSTRVHPKPQPYILMPYFL